jgi:U32 family peptidase
MEPKKISDKKIELSSPAGGWCALRTAVASGADSVYFGVRDLNMRWTAENFDRLEISRIISYLHENNKKGYLTLNTIIYNHELKKAEGILASAKRQGVDAVILWDMSLFSICKRLGLDIHISTQAGVSNTAAFKQYELLGAKRIILARECGIPAIKEIAEYAKRECPSCQIEAFIHGAMCVSISGRCFLSHEAFNRSANRGQCLQPCRRMFYIEDIDGESRYRIGPNYILSPKDLCAMPFIDSMIEAGIDVFKIEGRNRSPEYVREATRCYRKAIDAYYKGSLTKGLKRALIKRLEGTYNRGLDSGFYTSSPGGLDNTPVRRSEKVYAGQVKRFFPRLGVAEVLVQKGPLSAGDRILITGKNTPAGYHIIDEMQKDKRPIQSAQRGERVGIRLPFRAHKNDKVFLIKGIGKKL